MILRPVYLLAMLLLVLTSCRDSPKEVIEGASEAAAQGDLVAVGESFSVTSVHRLERSWELAQIHPTEGWRALSEKLIFQGKALEVLDEQLAGDLARVNARAGVEVRDYYLRKEDGRWRIDLGAGPRFQRQNAEKNPERGSEAAKSDAGEKS